MSKQIDQNKKDFVHLYLLHVEHKSSDADSAKEFLASEGFDTEKLVTDGLKRIKRMQLLANARNTELEMDKAQQAKKEAITWVDALLNNKNFSIVELVRSEELSLSFRNLDSMDKEDIRDTLIRHFTLKFMDNKKQG